MCVCVCVCVVLFSRGVCIIGKARSHSKYIHDHMSNLCTIWSLIYLSHLVQSCLQMHRLARRLQSHWLTDRFSIQTLIKMVLIYSWFPYPSSISCPAPYIGKEALMKAVRYTTGWNLRHTRNMSIMEMIRKLNSEIKTAQTKGFGQRTEGKRLLRSSPLGYYKATNNRKIDGIEFGINLSRTLVQGCDVDEGPWRNL